ncbi:MAG: hypothetical protein H8E27_01695 [Verrucomicrobia subdivision 3 bacterium]|nr:hypothetical protein [Limisphaerales bacterium]
MKLPAKLGALLEIHWDDICSFTNETLPDAKPARCITIGRLAAKRPDHIIIATSLFDTRPDQPPEGDFVAIPLGVIRRIRRI